MSGTGTVYGLTDPRNGETRYVGATIKPLAKRLTGHLSGKAARRVRAWVAELAAAGLVPVIVPIRESVPAGDLLAAEGEEITRIIGAGGTLLNEHATARGEELNRQRCAAAERAGWAELATVALGLFGGPMPPDDLPEVEIPDVSWRFMSKIEPGHEDRVRSLGGSGPAWDERYELHRELRREQETAVRELWRHTCGAWGEVRGLAERAFGDRLESHFARATETPCARRQDASRHLALIVWYMVAVQPWRHLAELGGLPLDDASFITWAGKHTGTREALGFLAAREGSLAKLSEGWYPPREPGPGHLLGIVAAAYSGKDPAQGVHYSLLPCLDRLARDHELTQPMADLFMRVCPRALDSVFGPDVAAEIDRELGLPPGTAGAVLRVTVKRLGGAAGGTERIADRSTGALPVTSLPDYGGCSGHGVVAARAVSAHLVQAGLAESEWLSREDYLAKTRGLWVPETRERAP